MKNTLTKLLQLLTTLAAVRVAAVAALASIVLEYGFHDPVFPQAVLLSVQLAAVAVYVSWRFARIIHSGSWREVFRECRLDIGLLAGVLIILMLRREILSISALKASAVCVFLIQAVLLIRVAIGAFRLNLLLSQTNIHPTRTIVITFLVLISIGTMALALPRATTEALQAQEQGSVGYRLLNSAFTATSATCVTGLGVYDTEKDFTTFGKVVILVLIQLGGLGIMLFGSVLSMLLMRKLSLKQALVVQDELSHQTVGDMGDMMRFVIIVTVLTELIGAIILYPMWPEQLSRGERVFNSVFHSVSAFCNAGFALQSDSLISYSRSASVFLGIMPLIILGGLGFPVLKDLKSFATSSLGRLFTRANTVSLGNPVVRRYRLSLHTRLVVQASVLLVVVPAVLFVVFESVSAAPPAGSESSSRVVMSEEGVLGKCLDALFLSVTCRTAGFNTVDMDTGALSSASRFLAMVLMFIGGAPASTAGGVKVMAVVVLVLAAWTQLRGRRFTEVFHRRIPDVIVQRSGVLVLVMFLIVTAVTILLCAIERVPLADALFESVSACGTVGLSNGLTAGLSSAGRVVIMAAMFVGRLGPLTLLIALAGQTTAAAYEYPEEQVGIG